VKSFFCEICNSRLNLVKTINKPEKNENIFNFSKNNFIKKFYQCENCYHIFNYHSFIKKIDKVYADQYNINAHKNLEDKFNKINSLKKNKSSNLNRLEFLYKFIKKKNKIIDIGSGIGIFPFSLKKKGFEISCIEYDKNANYFLNKLGLNSLRKSIINYKIPKKYDFITFNKILEHLNVKQIKIILNNIYYGCKVYIEVPSIKAKKKGFKRQEFFLEHQNIFSKKSLKILVKKLNFKVIKISDIREVNQKFTLRAVIEKKK
jgi:hypothetical protein